MADIRKLVKVFLASPGDLPDERKQAKFVVDEFNALWAEELGYHVELIGWEDTVSVFGRPQAIINRELERCELFVGLMWKRWGTPPSHSGPYSSGFEEEFELSINRRLTEKRPEISLLFKEVDQDFLRDPGEELKKVIAFKNRLIAEKSILFAHFSDIRDFEAKFRRCVTTYVRNLRSKELKEASNLTQSPTIADAQKEIALVPHQAPQTPLSVEGARFLREFVSRTEQDAELKDISDAEIARFRLLTTLVGRETNDDVALGVHDANRLYSARHAFAFGNTELTGLLKSGLEHYSNENVPLWYWLAAINGLEDELLFHHSAFASSTDQRVGALEAMWLISRVLPNEPTSHPERQQVERGLYIRLWFAKDAPSVLRAAALRYLGDCGLISDLEVIRKELDRKDNQTMSHAVDATIKIAFRESRESAIAALYELRPTSIGSSVLDELFNNEGLSTEMLLRGVDQPDAQVRRIVARALRERRELPNEVAEQLLTDSDAAIRYEGLKSLADSGRAFSKSEAKRILVRPGGLASRGLFGGGLDLSGEASFRDFSRKRMRALKDRELEETLNQASIFDQDAYFTLAERRFKERAEELRRSIDDQFKGHFERVLKATSEGTAGDNELLAKTRTLEDYLRKDLTRKGLDIICRKAKSTDLERVRTALRSGTLTYSVTDVEYIRRFGEWKDIPLLIDSLNRPDRSTGSFLSRLEDSDYRAVARAIHALGRNKFPQVLALPAPNQLLVYLLVEAPDKAFRSLSETTITLLFRSKDNDVRRTTALKCIRCLPKKRVTKLLADYISGDQYRYYNVVHWLDFGVSAPADRVVSAVDKVLRNEWRK